MGPERELALVSSIDARLRRSCQTFVDDVWPKIRHKFGNCSLVPVEGSDYPLARMIDFAGIDYLLDRKDGDPFGIAQRTQERRENERSREWPWNNITMGRHQFDRLKRAFDAPWGRLTPAVVIQSCVTRSNDDLVSVDSVGIVRTDQFMSYAMSCTPRQRDWAGEPFYFWSFEELATVGVHVDRFPSPSLSSPFGPIEFRYLDRPTAAS